MQKILGIDVDGVCADLHTPWIGDYNLDWKDSLKSSDITDWYIHQFVKPECGLKIYEYIEDPALYDKVSPIAGALGSIIKLREFGFRIIYVTSSTRGTMGRKYDWLSEYGFVTKLDDYVETKDKSLILTDALIDDYHGNLENFVGYKFLFDSPWNQGKARRDMVRVYDWEDATDMIISILKGE